MFESRTSDSFFELAQTDIIAYIQKMGKKALLKKYQEEFHIKTENKQ